MSPKHGFEGTDDLMFHAVERERVNRRPACGGDPRHPAARPSEMKVPCLRARIEQPHQPAGPGITGQLPRPFAQRTMDAGQGKVCEHRGAARDLRHDVIHVKSGGLPELRQPSIFAAISGSRGHAPAKTGGHCHHLFRGLDLRAKLQDGQRARHLRQGLDFPALVH